MKSLSGSVVKVVPVFNAKQLVIDNTTHMLWKYAVFFGHGHQPVEAWWSNNYMLAMSNIYPIHIISWFCSHQKGVEWCPIPSARPCPAAGNSKYKALFRLFDALRKFKSVYFLTFPDCITVIRFSENCDIDQQWTTYCRGNTLWCLWWPKTHRAFFGAGNLTLLQPPQYTQRY